MRPQVDKLLINEDSLALWLLFLELASWVWGGPLMQVWMGAPFVVSSAVVPPLLVP